MGALSGRILPALVITNHPSSRDAKYATSIRTQGARLETIADLEDTYGRRACESNLCFPERILLYLNRVSEGQFVQAHQVEVDAIRSASKKLQVMYAPKCHFCPKAARPQVVQVMRK
ncbi:hypothetical protein KI688_006337 [Linnemannia hyalina]|uniref:Piwi domain-containing protein n=1 Tax=Linnemannia hyalina TaxID=64524 RepID=A0A9P8BY72_9FUNG|nr:hypothetical protein KI688_006337 [Linnemannia hyalina]